jgi:hypothetical protein
MKELSMSAMRTIEGGASKYVTCPICGYVRKSSLLERLFVNNREVTAKMSTLHFSAMKGYKPGKSVHR